jgi:hypothetical protein
MRVPILAMSAALLVPLAAAPSAAQYATPVAVRRLEAPATMHVSGTLAAPVDTLPQSCREISAVGTIVGGAVGGAVGALVGIGIASRTNRSCTGEFCGLGEGLVGFGLGESIGLAVGAHLGSRSPRAENVVFSSVASVGILVGGVLAAVALERVDGGVIMIPLTPAFQLAAALAIESH